MISVHALKRDFRTAQRAVPALQGIELDVKMGSFLVLLGPSGSGKTTLLRCIAGLETPDEGEIEIGGEIVFSTQRKVFAPPERRRLGMVFQSYAVWPHLTVEENVALPLRRGANRISRAAARERVGRTLAAVKLEGLGNRPTTTLSGGQQQRVALARALAIEPCALLMDEPLSNLDARLREEIRAEIKAAVRLIGVTVLYVTHDQAEAMALADEIAVMDGGRIVQIGSPSTLYRHPATPRVAEFFGSINWMTRRLRGSEAVTIGIRPEDVRLRLGSERAPNEVSGHVVEQTFFGDHRICRVRTSDALLVVKITAGDFGDLTDRDVWVEMPEEKLHVFAREPADASNP
jgi:iron(III) transport system ATP-binding protein